MAFTLPTFNLKVKYWRIATWTGSYPPIVPPQDGSFDANCAFGLRTDGFGPTSMVLLCPAGTDVRDGIKEQLPVNSGDIVEVPKASGRYYQVVAVDDAGRGFPNEHRVAMIIVPDPSLVATPPWPTPYP